MLINSELCIGCGMCISYCPLEAIELKDDYAEIDMDQCAECGVCRRAEVCPTDAFEQQSLKWPRSIRSSFSDPLNVHKETDMAGRGTSETKTNDVTGRFKRGFTGVGLEIGRPSVGTRIREIEKLSVALIKYGVELEPLNPLTQIIDLETGKLPEEALNENVISAIIEFAIKNEKLVEVLGLIKDITDEMDTVVSITLGCRANEDGTFDSEKIVKEAGLFYRPNAKVNMGLGKPLYQ